VPPALSPELPHPAKSDTAMADTINNESNFFFIKSSF
jgi:hypothetical protein